MGLCSSKGVPWTSTRGGGQLCSAIDPHSVQCFERSFLMSFIAPILCCLGFRCGLGDKNDENDAESYVLSYLQHRECLLLTGSSSYGRLGW